MNLIKVQWQTMANSRD